MVRDHLLTSISTLALAVAAGPAFAGSPMDQPGWQGLYFGAFGGVNHLSAAMAISEGGTPESFSKDANLGIFGAEVGRNWQHGNQVFGFEADFGYSNGGLSTSQSENGEDTVTQTARIRGMATARLRAGFARGNSLFFITGGLALADLDNSGTDDLGSALGSTSGWRPGGVVGAGAEFKLNPHMSLKTDVLAAIFNAGHAHATGSDGGYDFSFHNTAVVGRVGLNFGF